MLASAVLAATAQAQTYPSRTVHLIVAYSAGGTGDFVARVLSDKLASALGQAVVVENRAGASGAIGTQSVIAAAPEQFTAFVKAESEKYLQVIRETGVKPE